MSKYHMSLLAVPLITAYSNSQLNSAIQEVKPYLNLENCFYGFVTLGALVAIDFATHMSDPREMYTFKIFDIFR